MGLPSGQRISVAIIQKADGKQRPLAIAALEDKIVQGATVMLLNAIYEGDFCGFSYGFRPGRGPHDALDALSTAIKIRKVNWILDADIQNFFGAVSQDWLVRYLEHRIGDKRIISLIQLYKSWVGTALRVPFGPSCLSKPARNEFSMWNRRRRAGLSCRRLGWAIGAVPLLCAIGVFFTWHQDEVVLRLQAKAITKNLNTDSARIRAINDWVYQNKGFVKNDSLLLRSVPPRSR
jgi:hypothetical protein